MTSAVHPPQARSTGWIMPPWTLPLWLAAVLWGWWERFAHDLGGHLADAAGRVGVPMVALLAAALAARALGWLVETAFYALAWRAQGERLRFAPLAVALASCSVFDLLAASVHGMRAWAGSPLVTLLCGAAPSPGDAVWTLAIAGFGLCAVARMVCTAVIQARALGRGLAGPLVLTVAAVAASRLAAWMILDLARGRSPL